MQTGNGNSNGALPAYITYEQMRIQEDNDAEAQRKGGKRIRNGCVEFLVGEGRWKRNLGVVVVCTIIVGMVVGVLVVRRRQEAT